MRFRDALQSKAGSLTESDRRIGNTLLGGMREVRGLTAAQLAERANVHESTVVRFAQKLGYDGYPELRAELLSDFQRQVDVAQGRTKIFSDRDPSLAAVVAAQVELISDLPRMVSQSSIDRAADILGAARLVLVIGRGLMTAPASFLTRKLGLVGVATTHSEQGGAEAVERAALLKPGDAVVIFAFNDEYAGFAALVDALSSRGVRGILVTDQAALLESLLPEVVLAVPRRHTDHGVMGAIMILGYALEYAMAARMPEQTRRASDEITELAASGRLSHLARRSEQAPDFGRGRPDEQVPNGVSPK